MSLLPQCTPEELALRFASSPAIRESPRFSRPRPRGGNAASATGFDVEHYAGPVSYRTDNLMGKNKEQVSGEQRGEWGRRE